MVQFFTPPPCELDYNFIHPRVFYSIVVGILGGKRQIWGVKKGVTITILVWGVNPYFSLATLNDDIGPN